MIGVQLIGETRLDLANFITLAEKATGRNHARATDAKRMASQLAAEVSMLDDFAGNDNRLSLAVTYVGFLFAGLTHDIAEIIEYTRGMPHLHTNYVESHLRCVIVVGNLDQWHKAVVEGCKASQLSAARAAFNKVYLALCQKGFNRLFDGTKTTEQKDGTFLIGRS